VDGQRPRIRPIDPTQQPRLLFIDDSNIIRWEFL
jgi:hypothetical protein